MNKANSLHNPCKLEEFIAQRRRYQLDSQGRIPTKQLSINTFMVYCRATSVEVQTDT
jgi:hypothetical protein